MAILTMEYWALICGVTKRKFDVNLLVTQGEAKYSAPFEPVAEPFVLEFTPVPASALNVSD